MKERKNRDKEKQEPGAQVCGLHTVLIEKDVYGAGRHVFEPAFYACAGQITVFRDVVHLLPVGDGHLITDMRRAVFPVHVSLLVKPESHKFLTALLILRPTVKIADPFPVVVDFPKVGPFLSGVGDSVCAPQKSHSKEKKESEAKELLCRVVVPVSVGDHPF